MVSIANDDVDFGGDEEDILWVHSKNEKLLIKFPKPQPKLLVSRKISSIQMFSNCSEVEGM